MGQRQLSAIRIFRPHDTDSLRCWCRPKFFMNCPECDVVGADCWRCNGQGCLPITLAEAEATEETVMIVHNDV